MNRALLLALAALAVPACSGSSPEGERPTGPAYSTPSAGGGKGGAAQGTAGGESSGGAAGETSALPPGLVCGVEGCEARAGAAGSGGAGAGGAGGAVVAGAAGAGGAVVAGAGGAVVAGAGAGGAVVAGAGGAVVAGAGGAVVAGAGGAVVAGAGGGGGAVVGGAGGGGGAVVGGAGGGGGAVVGGAGGAGGAVVGGAGGAGGAVVAGAGGAFVAGAAGAGGGDAGSAGVGGASAGSAGVAGWGVAGSAGTAATGGAPGYPPPTAYWPLDVVEGVATAEAQTIRGAAVGDVSSALGLSGGALHINALQSYLWAPSGVWTQPLTSATFSLWVKPDDDWTGLFSHDFLRRGTMSLTRYQGNVRFAVGPFGSIDEVSVAAPLLSGRWYHIVATYESGVAISLSIEDSQTPGSPVTGSNQASFGSIDAVGPLDVLRVQGGAFHAGALDDLAIFDAALTASQRADLFNLGVSGLSPVCPACTPALVPVHAWRFDEPSYGRATEELASQLPSATIGLSEAVMGRVSGALHVPELLSSGGTYQPGSGVVLASHPALHSPSLTLAAWVRPDRDLVPADTKMAWFESADVLPNRGFWFGYDQGLALTLGDGMTGNKPRQTQALTLSAGDWHHVAATFDGALTAIYLDGVPAGTSPAPFSYSPGDAPLHLCGNTASAIGLPVFPGACDEMAIFSTALTPAEIQALYDRGIAGQPLWP
ncbi:MAG: LamG domain-containing protein [Polyangiaceae bacterium]|nr:LamG domain-containing protein [Polyangiaceae bacterium]